MSPKIQLLLGFLGALAVLGLFLSSIYTIRYRLTAKHLRISWLGVPVRWVRLKDIRQIAVNNPFWCERWHNTYAVKNRRIVIYRRRGLFRALVITPQNPFVFLAELQKAIKALNGGQSVEGLTSPTNRIDPK